MNEYMTLSRVSASVVYMILMTLGCVVVYGIGLLIEWRRKK